MRKSQVKQSEKRCGSNCNERDEKMAKIQKETLKHKLENDALVVKLKQLAEESKKIIDTVTFQKQTKPVKQEFQEEVNKKELENAKKQMEFYEKRIKQLEKAQDEQSFEAYSKLIEDLKKLEDDIEKAKTKNSEFKKSQREQEKFLLSDQPVSSRNEMRKQLEILMGRVNSDKKSLEKKKENQEKMLKKIDELEAKYKEVCQKSSVTPISRPDFTVAPEEIDFSTPQNKSIIPRSKSDVNVLKSPQTKIVKENSKPVLAPKISESLILQSKQNVGRISKSIKSFEKTHIQKLADLQEKEKQISTQKADLERDLFTVQQECLKAHQILKELQKLPKDVVLEQSKLQTLITEVQPIIDEAQQGSKTLSQKNKYKKETQGVKALSEQSIQWKDHETLPEDKQYKINNLKIYFKDHFIIRIETEYKLQDGQSVTSVQPLESDSLIKERDVKSVDIKFGRTENIQEISGFNDSTHITYLKFKTSYFKEYFAGESKLSYKQKEFKFGIQPVDKPISFFGSFDSIKGYNKQVLAQFGVEMMKKDIIQYENRRSISSFKGNNFSQTNESNLKKSNYDQELVA